MTLEEFLEKNINGGVSDIYLYDKDLVCLGCYSKKYLLEHSHSGILYEKVKSFEIGNCDLYIILDF